MAIDPALQKLVNQALGHHRNGELSQAEEIYRRVLAQDPGHADALHLLGMVAYQTGRVPMALELIRQAILVHPSAASYHSNLGNVLQAQNDLEEAAASYRRALALTPGLSEVHVNLGNVLQAQGHVDVALDEYRRALALKPDLPEARAAESMALLLLGDFTAGWRNFEARWQTRDYDTPMRHYPLPLWDGQPLASGRLLVWGEQGVGDEIMFAGLVPDLLRAGNSVVLDCDRRLASLFQRSFPGVEVVFSFDPERDNALQVTAHLPSGSLPRIFRSSKEAFRATTSPYLFANPTPRDQFRDRYAGGRRVGLAWYTRSEKKGRQRSIDLSTLAPIFAAPGVRWISLQYGDLATLEEQIKAAGAPVLVDRSVDQLADIDGFAAQIAALDLVITIDNSTAHLAAALGVPTWLLLPFAPNWRWQLKTSASPWYPTLRIFRQSSLGDWSNVITAVQTALLRPISESTER
ncbi:MAG TPA: tetratricopeptide repeat protein [Terracidiphilus sp.]|nr:tetratricopeptide repeat protein [Terracidiphilus sp.]